MSARLAIAYPLVKLASNETATLPVQSRVWTYRLLSPAADASGNQAFREETRTLYRASSEDVIHMRASIPGLARGAFADPLPYMECRMLDLNPTRIRKISLSRQGREETVTVNDDGVWSVESPPEGQISEGAVPALLEWASNLQAERVECAALTNAPSFGLDESAERVTFGVSGGGIQKTLLIGRDNGQGGVFSMVQGQDVVFVLKRSVTESLMRPLVKGP